MKKVIPAIAAVAALAFSATPASAQDLIQHTLDTNADAWQVNANGKANIAVTCAAYAKPNALAVSFNECFLRGANGVRYNIQKADSGATPGAASATVGATTTVPVQDYDVCVRGSAFYQDNTYLVSDLNCNAVYRFNN